MPSAATDTARHKLQTLRKKRCVEAFSDDGGSGGSSLTATTVAATMTTTTGPVKTQSQSDHLC
jgi:hypothetical protein